MSARKRFSPGDRVTCRHAVEAYYSSYAGNPRWEFTPGTIGTIASIAPKVRIVNDGDPRHDGCDTRLVVDYDDKGTTRRVSLNFCNAVKV